MFVLACMVLECTQDISCDSITYNYPRVDIVLRADPLLSGLRVGGGDPVRSGGLLNKLDDIVQLLRTLSPQIALRKSRENGHCFLSLVE